MSSAKPADGSATSFGGTIYLLRHGAVQSQKDGKRYIGWQDLPLSRIGVAQATTWADHFKGLGLEEICCSDLIRCRETARIIAAPHSLVPCPCRELREIHMGAWEGKTFQEVNALHPRAFKARGQYLADHRPPEGESFRDLQNRVWPLFEAVVRRLRHRTLVVTHAGVIRVLLCRLLSMPLDHLFSIGQSHGALNIIDIRPDGFRLQAMNLQLTWPVT